jgi:hypothetical protein
MLKYRNLKKGQKVHIQGTPDIKWYPNKLMLKVWIHQYQANVIKNILISDKI